MSSNLSSERASVLDRIPRIKPCKSCYEWPAELEHEDSQPGTPFRRTKVHSIIDIVGRKVGRKIPVYVNNPVQTPPDETPPNVIDAQNPPHELVEDLKKGAKGPITIQDLSKVTDKQLQDLVAGGIHKYLPRVISEVIQRQLQSTETVQIA